MAHASLRLLKGRSYLAGPGIQSIISAAWENCCAQRRKNAVQMVNSARTFASTSASAQTNEAESKAPSDGRMSDVSTTVRFDFDEVRKEIVHMWIQAQWESGRGHEIRARYCSFTYEDAVRAYHATNSTWHWLDRELSSNLAGETGAVYIYHGAEAALLLRQTLAQLIYQSFPHEVTQEIQSIEAALDFCREHCATEASHLALFMSVVPNATNSAYSSNASPKHTMLLPVWRVAGWTLGFLPTFVTGSCGLYATVEQVESFVEKHFDQQIQYLKKDNKTPELVRLLEHCCADEVHHKEEAASALLKTTTEQEIRNLWWYQPWGALVRLGSATAAEVARRI